MADADETIEGRDRGATVVVVAVALVGLLASVAFVVDLGLSRHSRRANQSAADLAALAAGEALGTDPAPDGRAGCAAAVRYLIANVGGLPSGVTVPCTSLPANCDSTTAPTTVADGGTAGDFTIEITFPVADADIADSQVADTSSLRLNDGMPCERLTVELTNEFDSLFSGVLGNDQLAASASATVRQIQASDRRVPSLWLLEPNGCPALSVSGGSSVTVGTATKAGLITIDSDASSCSGNSFTIDASGAGSTLHAISGDPTTAPEITLVAMDRLQATCNAGNLNACDPADVANLSLFPQPARRPTRATRSPVDHTYNCKSSYPDYHGVLIRGCTTGLAPYIDHLRSEIGASGTPAGFTQWSTLYGCNNPVVPAAGLDGNWHVDCATFKITSADVQFNGGNVVFDGHISLTGGSLTFNSANPAPGLPGPCLTAVVGCIDRSSRDAAWVFMRDGDLSLTGGALNAVRTTIVQENGWFSIAGGSPPAWTAPAEGPFAGLSVWSESTSNKYKISGGASMELEGTFFTPEAVPMNISGGSPVNPQEAQFVARQLAITGGAALRLAPSQISGVAVSPDPPLLIR
jgi:hypothetical protein